MLEWQQTLIKSTYRNFIGFDSGSDLDKIIVLHYKYFGIFDNYLSLKIKKKQKDLKNLSASVAGMNGFKEK